MGRARYPSAAEYHRQRWEEDYSLACAGKAPNGFDADEYRAWMEDLGREHGYLKPKSGADKLNEEIRAAYHDDILEAQRRVKGAPEG